MSVSACLSRSIEIRITVGSVETVCAAHVQIGLSTTCVLVDHVCEQSMSLGVVVIVYASCVPRILMLTGNVPDARAPFRYL